MLSIHLILLQFCNLYVQNYFINSLELIISLERLDVPPSFSFLHPSLSTKSSTETSELNVDEPTSAGSIKYVGVVSKK